MPQPAHPASDQTDVAVVASAIEIAATDGKPARRVMLLPYGTTTGRDGRGPYVLDGAEHAEKVIATTREVLGSADLLFCYDHQPEFAAIPGVGGQAKAAGWIKPGTLQPGADGIYGEVDWTPTAEAALAAREYRYHSPHFRVHPTTRKVTRLVNAALTNSPNFDLPALASQIPGAITGENPDMTKLALTAATLAAALGLPAEALDEAKVLAAIAQIKTDKDGAETALASVRKELKLGDDAGTEAVLAAVQSAGKAGEPDPSKYVPVAALTEIQGELRDIREERVTAMVDQAVTEGKIAPALRDWALALGKKDQGELQTFLGSAPVFEGTKPKVPGSPAAKHTTLTDEEVVACEMTGMSREDFLKAKNEEIGA